MAFDDLKLITPLLKAVEEAGYQTPSPIQQKAIPPILEGRDLLGCAQTGTGKTAAFALPILQLLAEHKLPKGTRPIRVLVLTPTRELALQIHESFQLYAKGLELRSAVIFGGVNQGPQVTQLKRGIDILVATPGRLNDLIGQGFIKLNQLEIFVLDEADRMLDMGFVQDVKKIIRLIPQKRQTLLFSATMPKEIVDLANSLLINPEKVFVTPQSSTVEKIEQHLYKVDKTNKRHLLAKLLRDPAIESALVFTRTKHGADRVVRELKREGVLAMAIHGNKSQNARQNALSSFKDGRVRVLVATDIAARGLDINDLSHVINYDLPNIPETYVHRIGRTGRAGRAGISISFCCYDELPYLADIEKLIGFPIPLESNPEWPMEVLESAPKPDTRGQNNKSASKPARAPRPNTEKKTNRSAPVKQVPAVPIPEASAPKAPAAADPRNSKAPRAAEGTAGKPNPKNSFKKRGAGPMNANPYDNRTGGAAIVTRRPVWSNLPQASEAPLGKGDEDMSRNNRRRRGGKKRSEQGPNQPETTPAASNRVPPIKKNEKGVFDFSESELAEDDSLRLITSESNRGDTKYASFEDFLKDH